MTQDSSVSVDPESQPTHVPQAMLDIDPNLKVDPALVQQDRVQIMDLHTSNPIVSYKNQIFTCSWVDLLGTELIFASPDETSDVPTLRRGTDFELLSASRVKVLGQKANLISAAAGALRQQEQQEQQRPQSREQAQRSDARLPLTNQGRFLQRLAETKRAKGERDPVRTTFPTKRLYDTLNDGLRDWEGEETPMAAEPGQSSQGTHSMQQKTKDAALEATAAAIQEPEYDDENIDQP